MNKVAVRNTLKNVRRSIEKYVSENTYSSTAELNGMCGISSYALLLILKRMGYSPTFCMGDYHCFLKLDGYWVDLTLKQFNERCPKIYFRRTPYTHDDGYGNVHYAKKTAKTSRKIRRLFRGWPAQQNPFRQQIPNLLKQTA